MQVETGSERAVAGPPGSRVALVCRLLLDALPSVIPADGVATVLDCGGGSGAYAVPLALAGAQVTVLDISADALATLHRRAAEAGVSESVRAVAADVDALGDTLRDYKFDLVLAHGVLHAVERVASAFAGIAETVRPGGLLSILVANPYASVLARVLAGEPGAALAELRELDSAAGPAAPESIEALCARAGLTVEARYGIGAFSDLVPRSAAAGSVLDAPAARDALAQLDLEAAARPPFADLAGRIHLLARRPAG